MAFRRRPGPALLTFVAGLVAASAYFGAVGLMTGFLAVSPTMAARLPFQSPVVGGIALALVVALPSTAVCVLSHRRHPRVREAAALAGCLLVSWIVIELAFVRQFSALQVIYALAGALLIMLGDRAVLARAGSVISALPMFVTAPLFRSWHLRWGATDEEVRASMPGDAGVEAALHGDPSSEY
jgi:hypothetical protein